MRKQGFRVLTLILLVVIMTTIAIPALAWTHHKDCVVHFQFEERTPIMRKHMVHEPHLKWRCFILEQYVHLREECTWGPWFNMSSSDRGYSSTRFQILGFEHNKL